MNAGKRLLGQVAGVLLQVGGRAAASAVNSVVKDGKKAARKAGKKLDALQQQIENLMTPEEEEDVAPMNAAQDPDEIIAEVVTPQRKPRHK